MNLKIRDLEASKGEKVSGFINIEDTNLKIPITLINGECEGKSILITAGIHGCEYLGIETVNELVREIDPKEVSGRIIFVHMANVSGFFARVPAIVPEDGINLNRAFPGKNEGSVAEKIAYTITHELQLKVDFYIDLHGGDLHEKTMPFVYYPGKGKEEVINASCEAAKHLNLKYRVKSNATSGAYNSAAILGIPSLLIERGGCGLWKKSEVDLYKQDIYRILEHEQVIKKELLQKNGAQKEIKNAIYIDSEFNGYWYPKVNQGDKIQKGQLIGLVCDCFGKKLKDYYSEVDGVVLYITLSLAISKSNSLIAYGEENCL
ncbi:N-alpha-acetyl-L-2,4-diaminobutyric acid deacetylase [Clostridium puniceum]|uniref:N-alpha-acetyl-L-2,4-diaminobutyric acid deacetylase n=1 Tax=Clostridium puniceum TaxID=29367 RepID=A0A1S8TPS9_9CLOT|nr:M14 family metallopeptidase [Clostridium puniceum]OOM79644.1 N-alpha-acetyl-L-2,4-diaminobutyric acid deacetylase [Clostridium puniceum]